MILDYPGGSQCQHERQGSFRRKCQVREAKAEKMLCFGIGRWRKGQEMWLHLLEKVNFHLLEKGIPP